MDLSRRGWISKNGIPATVASFYKTIMSRNSSFCGKVEDKSFYTEQVTNVTRGVGTAVELFKVLCRRANVTMTPDLFENECLGILRQQAVVMFSDSLDGLNKPTSGVPLGQLAIDQVKILTGSNLPQDLVDSLIQAHPILQAYAIIEEMYMNLTNTAKRLDLNSEEWALTKKTLSIP